MKKIISIVSLPRSGSTLLTAIFDSHPSIACWYEIYSSRSKNELPIYKSFSSLQGDYYKHHRIDLNNYDYLVIKETNTFPKDIQSISGIEYVSSIYEGLNIKNEHILQNIWLTRDIRHNYLSRIEGLIKWWGKPDQKITTEGYIKWVNEAYDGFQQMKEFSKKHDTIHVCYEKLMTNFQNEVIKLFEALEIPFSENILNYNKNVCSNFIHGDINVAQNPQLPNTASIEKRNIEWKELESKIYPIPKYAKEREEELLKFNYQGTIH